MKVSDMLHVVSDGVDRPVEFKDVWREIHRLIEVNAKHRRGFRLQEIDCSSVLEHVTDEVEELINAHDSYSWGHVGSDRDVAIELADAMGVLFHFAIKMGYTPESLSRLMLDKFKLRFTEGNRDESKA